VCFLLRNWHVLDAFRDNEELAFFQLYVALPKSDDEVSFHYQEQLVLILMRMPDELSFELNELDIGVVYFADNFGLQ